MMTVNRPDNRIPILTPGEATKWADAMFELGLAYPLYQNPAAVTNDDKQPTFSQREVDQLKMLVPALTLREHDAIMSRWLDLLNRFSICYRRLE